jgi:hypothetical protein
MCTGWVHERDSRVDHAAEMGPCKRCSGEQQHYRLTSVCDFSPKLVLLATILPFPCAFRRSRMNMRCYKDLRIVEGELSQQIHLVLPSIGKAESLCDVPSHHWVLEKPRNTPCGSGCHCRGVGTVIACSLVAVFAGIGPSSAPKIPRVGLKTTPRARR